MSTRSGIPASVERVVLPSRIRRGRMATAPVWHVTLPDGEKWQFQTKRAALAFHAAGGECGHERRRGADCWDCNGWLIQKRTGLPGERCYSLCFRNGCVAYCHREPGHDGPHEAAS